ncbi:hypothetical protein OAU96_01955, partial [Planctomycetota bacterium]|nr:hypothetical protein [Planctomycetota bacterium]
MLVNLYGVLENPSTRNPTCLLRIIDVTEAHEKKPVFCNAPNWSNDEGQFASTMNFEAPYRQTDFSGYTIGLLPLPILDFPKKGRRKIRIIAVIFDGLIPLGTVEKDAYYNNPNKGYLDIIEAIRTSEVTIAKLSVAVSAIDGS